MSRVSVEVQEEPLSVVLEALRKQGVRLVYSSTATSRISRVRCSCAAVAVEFVLEQVLTGTDLTFKRLEHGEYLLVPRAQPGRRFGMLRGRVTEEATDRPLVGALIQVGQGGPRAISDDAGSYTIRNVPMGTQTLTFSSIGYSPQQLDIVVADGLQVLGPVALRVNPIEMKALTVNAAMSGQARALNQQMNAPVITTIVAADHIRSFPDPSLDASLARMPGMTRVTGLGDATPVIEVNGQRLASTDLQGRGTDLSGIATDMIEEIRVAKTFTPDMPGDATGGKVEIVTRRPVGSQRILDFTASGGLNMLPQWNNESGMADDVNRRASLNFGRRSESVSYFLGTFYRRDGYFNERLRQSHGGENFGNGLVVVPRELGLMYMPGTDERYGASADIDLYPSDRTALFIRASVTRRQTDQELFQYVHNIGRAGYADASTTAQMRGQISNVNETRHRPWTLANLSAGGKHALAFADLDYSASFAYGKERRLFSNLNFIARDGFGYRFDVENRRFPDLEITGTPPDPSSFLFNQREVWLDESSDNGLTGALNLRIPVAPALRADLRIGARIDSKMKRGERERERATTTTRPLTLADFPTESAGMLGGYTMPFIIREWDRTREHAALDRDGVFVINNTFTTDQSNQTDFDFREHVLASYALATAEFGRASLLAGVRVEHTMMNTQANALRIGPDQSVLGIEEVTDEQSYTDLFPSLQLRYQLAERTMLRAAATRTIARPRFRDLSPYRYEDERTQTVSLGNGALRPMRATNLDLSIEHYLANVGVLSLGAFAKDMKDFVFTQRRELTGDEYDGWEEVKPVNGDEGRVYGFEVAWQQNLDFLPGPLDGLSLYANHTTAISSADYGREAKLQMLNVVPGVFNVALSFRHAGFSSNVAYQRRSRYLTNTATSLTPAILEMEGFYGDRYYGHKERIDVSIQQALGRSTLFLDVRDLMGTNEFRYHGRPAYPFEDEFGVWSFHGGVRMRF